MDELPHDADLPSEPRPTGDGLEDFDIDELDPYDGPAVLELLPAVDVANGQAVRLVQGAAGSETSYGDPLDAALVDDSQRYHGVTPVEPEIADQPAWRDVLVVTFRRA